MGAKGERQSVPVSLPADLVRELDELVEEGMFGSRSDALRYGARLVAREHRYREPRLHEVAADRAREAAAERQERREEERDREDDRVSRH